MKTMILGSVVMLAVFAWGASLLAGFSEPSDADLKALAAEPVVDMKDDRCVVRGAVWDASIEQPIPATPVNLVILDAGQEKDLVRSFSGGRGRFRAALPRGTFAQVRYRDVDGRWQTGASVVCLAHDWATKA